MMRSSVLCATYNVHRCRGRDGSESPERIVDVLRELDADLIGLQEVGTTFDGEARLFELASKLHLNATAIPLVDRGMDWQGNALLTRFPILHTDRICVSVPGREPRAMLEAVVAVGDLRLRVLVVHFGLSYGERRRQVHTLLDAIRTTSADLSIVLGDFNEWRPRNFTVARLNDALGHTRAWRSFPTPFPLLALDRIWALPGEVLRASGVLRSPAAKVASDHFPVWAELDLERMRPSS